MKEKQADTYKGKGMVSLSAYNVDSLQRLAQMEMSAAHTYLSWSLQFRSSGFHNYAKWARNQFWEETSHALEVLDYLQDRQCPACVDFQSPLTDVAFLPSCGSMRTAIHFLLDHEQEIASFVEKLLDRSDKGSRPTPDMSVFLENILERQRKEIARLLNVAVRIDAARGNPQAIFMIGKELAGD